MKQRQLSANLRETFLKLKNGNTVRVQFNPDKVFPADPDSTLAILNVLEEHIRPGMRVLDIGTESGIIGVAAGRN